MRCLMLMARHLAHASHMAGMFVMGMLRNSIRLRQQHLHRHDVSRHDKAWQPADQEDTKTFFHGVVKR